MKKIICLVLVSICTCSFAAAVQETGEVKIVCAEYILTLTVYRTESHKIIDKAGTAEFYKMSMNEQLAVVQSDPNVRVVEKVLRMVYGQCELDALIRMQHAELQDDGTYVLVQSPGMQGTMANLVYEAVEGDPDKIKLSGICKVAENYGRAEFKPFPALDVGKSGGYFGGGLAAVQQPVIITLNETNVVQKYRRPLGRNKHPEVVITTLKVERAREWLGELSSILNRVNAWDARDPNPREGGGLRNELIITGK